MLTVEKATLLSAARLAHGSRCTANACTYIRGHRRLPPDKRQEVYYLGMYMGEGKARLLKVEAS